MKFYEFALCTIAITVAAIAGFLYGNQKATIDVKINGWTITETEGPPPCPKGCCCGDKCKCSACPEDCAKAGQCACNMASEDNSCKCRPGGDNLHCVCKPCKCDHRAKDCPSCACGCGEKCCCNETGKSTPCNCMCGKCSMTKPVEASKKVPEKACPTGWIPYSELFGEPEEDKAGFQRALQDDLLREKEREHEDEKRAAMRRFFDEAPWRNWKDPT